MAKRPDRGATKKLLTGVLDSFTKIGNWLWVDFAIMEGESIKDPTEFDATSATQCLREIRAAVDSGSVRAEQLAPDVEFRDDLRTWFALAHRYIGEALAGAETALLRQEFDTAFQLARSTYIRLDGDMAEWRARLAADVDGSIGVTVVGSKPKKWKRWPNGRPTKEQKQECEREARRILKHNPLIERDDLAERLGVSGGYVSKMRAWLKIHPPKAANVPSPKAAEPPSTASAPAATPAPAGDVMASMQFNPRREAAYRIACESLETSGSFKSSDYNDIDRAIDESDEADEGPVDVEAELEAIKAEQRNEAAETGCPIHNEDGTLATNDNGDPIGGGQWSDRPLRRFRKQAD